MIFFLISVIVKHLDGLNASLLKLTPNGSVIFRNFIFCVVSHLLFTGKTDQLTTPLHNKTPAAEDYSMIHKDWFEGSQATR